jgi:hypothetical protein
MTAKRPSSETPIPDRLSTPSLRFSSRIGDAVFVMLGSRKASPEALSANTASWRLARNAMDDAWDGAMNPAEDAFTTHKESMPSRETPSSASDASSLTARAVTRPAMFERHSNATLGQRETTQNLQDFQILIEHSTPALMD